jgi:amino acid adenylation domain-containing protein
LVEELVVERSLSYTPLFQVMFALNNTERGRSAEMDKAEMNSAQAGNEAEASRREQAPAGSKDEMESAVKFDLSLSLSDTGGRLGGRLEYSAELFEEATVRRMVEHYKNVLREVARDSGQRVSQIAILGEDERREIVEGWNQTERDYSQHSLIHQLIEEQAEAAADAEAVACEGQRLSYGELNKRANQLARYLRRRGVGPEVVVGIYMGRTVEMVVALLGVLKAGGAYVPLDGSYPIERLRYMVEDAGIEVVLTQRGFMEEVVKRASEGLRELINIDEEWEEISKESAEKFDSGVSAENLAYIIYTSGSTGKPKGVMIQHRSLINLVYWHLEHYNIQPDDRATLIASNGFDASVWETWPYLAVGACLLIPDEQVRAMPRQLSKWLVEQGVTLSFMPTPMVESVLAEAPPAGGSLKYLFAGGDQLHSFGRAGQEFKLVNIYGPTESTVVATTSVVARRGWAGEQPSIGRPIANTQVYVLDAQLQPVPIGVTGHLHIGGCGRARGYLNRPELTAE